jgi:protein-disulfide isomerase
MKSQYVLPITIVVAGALIAGAIFLAGKAGTASTSTSSTGQVSNARPYTPGTDHILGNPNAPVKIVEYMDLECPHCKNFQTTMNQIMDYYNQAMPGVVAWVVRPFPLASIHSKAPEEAQAAECAAAQGGDAEYFKYIDEIFAITPSDNGLDLTELPKVAQQDGLNVTTFNTCVSSGQFAQKVQDSYNEAISEGGQGTPFILIMVGSDAVALQGDQPYDSMRAAVDAVIAELPAGTASSTEASYTPAPNAAQTVTSTTTAQ